uniref:Reverse transcriptase Ty1/copia-type domain-containing protein n=1 Tax=Solanum lycopersicum TaxID=4081 RepID=A0A3Q7GTV7_SOLLC
MNLSRKMCPTVREEKENVAKFTYSSVVKILIYAMMCTRPDIAHAVGVVSRLLENPGKEHWEAVKWILRYLRGSSDECLCFGASNPILKGYTDSDMAGGAISWQSKLQKCVALSTTEAEYIAATDAGKEMIGLKRFLHELCLNQMNYQKWIKLYHTFRITGGYAQLSYLRYERPLSAFNWVLDKKSIIDPIKKHNANVLPPPTKLNVTSFADIKHDVAHTMATDIRKKEFGMSVIFFHR